MLAVINKSNTIQNVSQNIRNFCYNWGIRSVCILSGAYIGAVIGGITGAGLCVGLSAVSPDYLERTYVESFSFKTGLSLMLIGAIKGYYTANQILNNECPFLTTDEKDSEDPSHAVEIQSLVRANLRKEM